MDCLRKKPPIMKQGHLCSLRLVKDNGILAALLDDAPACRQLLEMLLRVRHRFFSTNRVKSLYLMHKTKAGYGSKTFLTYFNRRCPYQKASCQHPQSSAGLVPSAADVGRRFYWHRFCYSFLVHRS
jgi:hypothetical protein